MCRWFFYDSLLKKGLADLCVAIAKKSRAHSALVGAAIAVWRHRLLHVAGRRRYQVAMATRISWHRCDYDIKSLHSAAATTTTATDLESFCLLDSLMETQ